MEERRSHEKVKGDLEELRLEKAVHDKKFLEEIAALHEEISGLKQEQARSRADSSKMVSDLQDQIAKMARERDDLKNEVEWRKTSKHHKVKDYDRMKDQVAKTRATSWLVVANTVFSYN